MPLADATQTEPAKGRPVDKPARAHPGAVRVVAPARLHLGFLDLNGSLGRLFGSIGLAIDTPRTELVLKRARAFKGDGADHTRAVAMLRRFAEVFSLEGGLRHINRLGHPGPCRPRLGNTTRARRRRRPDGTRRHSLQPRASRRDCRPWRPLGHRHGGVRARRLHRRRRPWRYRPRPAHSRACRFP